MTKLKRRPPAKRKVLRITRYKFGFDIFDRVKSNDDPSWVNVGSIVGHLYWADNGEPYYKVNWWHKDGGFDHTTIEHAKSFEERHDKCSE